MWIEVREQFARVWSLPYGFWESNSDYCGWLQMFYSARPYFLSRIYFFSKDIIIVDRFAFLFFTFRETKLPTFNGYNF